MIFLLQFSEVDAIPYYESYADKVVLESIENETEHADVEKPGWNYMVDSAEICKIKDIEVLKEFSNKLELSETEVEKLATSIKLSDEPFYLLNEKYSLGNIGEMLQEWYDNCKHYEATEEFTIKIIRPNAESIYNTDFDIFGDSRPGYPDKEVAPEDVNRKIENWKNNYIKSVICLLSNEELEYYKNIEGGLLGEYKKAGFNVVHIPVKDHKYPYLNVEELEQVRQSFDKLEKYVLIHCSAGVDRTNFAIRHLNNIKRALEEV